LNGAFNWYILRSHPLSTKDPLSPVFSSFEPAIHFDLYLFNELLIALSSRRLPTLQLKREKRGNRGQGKGKLIAFACSQAENYETSLHNLLLQKTTAESHMSYGYKKKVYYTFQRSFSCDSGDDIFESFS